MSRKVFAAGEVLAASDVNTFLMDQTVMSFATSAARGSAIAAPVEGMATFLEDRDELEIWSGSAWRIPYGVTPLVSQSFTSSTSVIVSSCFSAKFDNYVVQVTTTNSGANARFQLRAGATTQTTGYSGVSVFGNGTSALSSTTPSSSFECFGDSITANIFRPFLTQTTSFTSLSRSSGNAPGIHSCNNTSTLSFDSLVLSFVTAETGVIRIYGLRA